jgi:hypothetical protein
VELLIAITVFRVAYLADADTAADARVRNDELLRACDRFARPWRR